MGKTGKKGSRKRRKAFEKIAGSPITISASGSSSRKLQKIRLLVLKAQAAYNASLKKSILELEENLENVYSLMSKGLSAPVLDKDSLDNCLADYHGFCPPIYFTAREVEYQINFVDGGWVIDGCWGGHVHASTPQKVITMEDLARAMVDIEKELHARR